MIVTLKRKLQSITIKFAKKYQLDVQEILLTILNINRIFGQNFQKLDLIFIKNQLFRFW